MDIDEDDDFYAPEEPEASAGTAKQPEPAAKGDEHSPEDLEEGEEEDQDGEMGEDDDDSVCLVSAVLGYCLLPFLTAG
jgi:pre-mRNA 3'-end-processing factor FIP1